MSRLFVSDVVIRDSTVSALGVVDGLVFVHWVRVAGDDVPGMDEAGDVAEAAEGDIDEGVSGAEADFDPYWWKWKVSNVVDQAAK